MRTSRAQCLKNQKHNEETARADVLIVDEF